MTNIIEETAIWKNVCFWESPPIFTNWAFISLMQQSHVQRHASWNLLCNANNFILLEKNLEKKDFATPTQIFKRLV